MTIWKSIRVERSQEIAFRVFCHEMNRWWPGGFGGPDTKLFLEGRVGGRFFERRTDGSEYEIGRVTAYQPSSVVAFTWRAPSWDFTTQVEVRFIPDGAGTRVELEHSGFEQNDNAREARKSYDNGWTQILGHFEKGMAAAE